MVVKAIYLKKKKYDDLIFGGLFRPGKRKRKNATILGICFVIEKMDIISA